MVPKVFLPAVRSDPAAPQAWRSRFAPSRGIAYCRARRYACRCSRCIRYSDPRASAIPSAKGQQRIWIVDFDHPSDFAGQARLVREYRGLQRNDRVDVIRIVGHQHGIVRAQTVADDQDVRSIRLPIDVVNERRPLRMQIGLHFDIGHGLKLGHEFGQPRRRKRPEQWPDDADKRRRVAGRAEQQAAQGKND